MPKLTIGHLEQLMRQCGGLDDNASLTLDTDFDDLGFDSLAVLELGSRIEQGLGIPMPDEIVSELTSPRAVLDHVNELRTVN